MVPFAVGELGGKSLNTKIFYHRDTEGTENRIELNQMAIISHN